MKNKIVVLITVILSISIVVLISNNMKDNKEIKLTDMTENNISYSKEKINKVLEFLTEKFVMPDTAEYIIEDLNIMTSN